MLAEETTPTVLSTVVLLGKDNGGKFHASRFPSDQAEAALRAARLMKLRAVKVSDIALDAAVHQLPEGKIYATGRGLVPFVKRELYDQFAALLGTPAEQALADEAEGPVKSAKPDSGVNRAIWAQLEVGSTVLAKASADEGWFEAIILSVEAEKDIATLRWRDYPTEPVVTKSRTQLGLVAAA